MLNSLFICTIINVLKMILVFFFIYIITLNRKFTSTRIRTANHTHNYREEDFKPNRIQHLESDFNNDEENFSFSLNI